MDDGEGSVVRASRIGADGTDLGVWTIVNLNGHYWCIRPDRDRLELEADSLPAAVLQVPEMLRLSSRVVHTFQCDSRHIHPADLAAVITTATPELATIRWQSNELEDGDCDAYADFFHDDHIPIDGTDGNIPVTINGARCFPVKLDHSRFGIVPFQGEDDQHEPVYLTEIGSVATLTEWGGNFTASLGMLPRGHLCEFFNGDDLAPTVTFEPLGDDSISRLHTLAFQWVQRLFDSVSFAEKPVLRRSDDGTIEVIWPEHYEPDHASARIISMHAVLP